MSGVNYEIHKYLVDFLCVAKYFGNVAVVLVQSDFILELIPDDVYGAIKACIDICECFITLPRMGEFLEIEDYLAYPVSSFVRSFDQFLDIAKQVAKIKFLFGLF